MTTHTLPPYIYQPLKRLTYPTLRWGYAFAFTAILTVLLVQPSTHPVVGPAAPPGPPSAPREVLLTLGHVISFSVLTMLWWWAFEARVSFWRSIVIALVIAFTLGIVTELLQSLVPDRSSSLIDLMANWISSAAVATFLFLYAPKTD